jgi:uncharacterized membrane protein
MSDGSLKTALIISLLVNAFLAAAAVAGAVYLYGAVGEHASLRQKTPLAMAARDLDPKVRDDLRQTMRSLALSAAPDFQEARAARKHAVELLSAPTFDAPTVEAELTKAREAENRGRAKLENGLVDFLKTQPQATRATVARAIPGRASLHFGGPRHFGPGGPGHDGPPPPDDRGPPPPPGQ